jgi:hypothetical protein
MSVTAADCREIAAEKAAVVHARMCTKITKAVVKAVKAQKRALHVPYAYPLEEEALNLLQAHFVQDGFAVTRWRRKSDKIGMLQIRWGVEHDSPDGLKIVTNREQCTTMSLDWDSSVEDNLKQTSIRAVLVEGMKAMIA